MPCTEIRAEWAAQRIQGLSLARAILNATALNKRSTDIKIADQRVRVSAARSRPDVGDLPRSDLAHRAPGPAAASRRRASKWKTERVVAVRAETRRTASDVPRRPRHLDDAVAHAGANARPRRRRRPARARDGLKYRDFLVVALMLKRENLFPDNWIYIHTPGVKVGRIQNFNNWSAAMVPTPGITCLGMEYFCFEGDGLWTSRDADLIAAGGRRAGSSSASARAEDVVDGKVVRMPKAYPIYDSVYRDHIDRIRALHRSDSEPAHGRPERHAQVQQPGPFDAHRHDDRREHARRDRTTSGRSTPTSSTTKSRSVETPEKSRRPARRLGSCIMRIGIDATCWAHERGYGRFTRELVTAMVRERSDHQFVCMLDGRSASAFGLSGPNVTTVVVRQATPPAVATAQGSPRSIRDMLRLTAAVRRTRVDAFLSLSIPAYFPLPPGLPAVATLHDTTVERSHTVKQRLLSRAAVRLALKQARLVLTVSDFAARDAVARLGVPPARMRVTLKGVSDIYRPTECPVEIRAAAERARLPPGARWLMYVGGFGAAETRRPHRAGSRRNCRDGSPTVR